ncbi:RING finger protein 10 [Hondaea fermentalgiana]|uniref:RING finger protein 10 n=1 Tax=Hondaea fermentalgiana TaxID=2315210 RepID=A0A2R5G706_9STRA|nr:RING finger protein 10 [Hondaea fermentalgiana]|eukprot:GBG25578.1 RING finger protein 10 [Hondaea fermentalgiana]
MYRLFMHASNTWEHCPLCQSFICEKDLRRISSIEIIPKVAVGDQIDLILLTRPRAGIVPVALESKGGDFAQRRLPSVHTRRATFSRFAIETKENVTRVGERDLNDLRYLMNEAQAFNDSFGSELIKRAYANVSGTMQRWAAPKAQESSHDLRSTVPIPRAGANAATGSSSASTTGGRRGGGGGGGSSAVGKLDQPEEDVQFYQIADARYVFLDSFVVKCLAHQFGADKTQFPPRLEKVRVVNVENIVLTPEVVKRNSYLVHVPIHANLYLVEIDLQEILSAETLEVFREEIASRARRRAAKLKAERRHEKQLSEKLKRMSLRGPLESNLGYSIDYRQYMEQRKRQEEQIQRELAHAFEASLTGDMVSEEEINAMLDSASAQQSNGIWGSAPQHIGSFASIVNSQSHFPELSSSPPTTNLSTSPQSSYSLSSSPGAGNGLSSTASKTGWATLSAPKPPTTSQHARTLVPGGLAPGTGATSAESGPSQAPQGAQGATSQEARSKGKNKSKNNKKAVLLSTAGRRGR